MQEIAKVKLCFPLGMLEEFKIIEKATDLFRDCTHNKAEENEEPNRY